MFTPKPHQIHRHSCRLTGFYCSEIPLFLGWVPCIHVTPAHCNSMKSSETAANSPNFPWIRSWHFNERKDNVWNQANSGWLPSMCHSNSTSCPSTQHFILYRPPSRSLNTSMLFGVGAASMFSQPLAPSGSRLDPESFCACLFWFVFIFMNGCRRGVLTEPRHNTAAIHENSKRKTLYFDWLDADQSL